MSVLPDVPIGPSLAHTISADKDFHSLTDEKNGKLSDTESFDTPRQLYVDGLKVEIPSDAPPLSSYTENRWTWLSLVRPKRQVVDRNAIATRASVYDDPRLAPHYAPR